MLGVERLLGVVLRAVLSRTTRCYSACTVRCLVRKVLELVSSRIAGSTAKTALDGGVGLFSREQSKGLLTTDLRSTSKFDFRSPVIVDVGASSTFSSTSSSDPLAENPSSDF